MPASLDAETNPDALPTLPVGWRYEELGNLVEERGICYGIVQPGNAVANGVPIVRVNNIRNRMIDTSDMLKVEPNIESKFKRSRLRGGEVLLTLVGTLGEVAIVPEKFQGWNVARAVGVIPVLKDPGSQWVAICLRSAHIQHCIRMWATSTVQATFNLRDVAKLPIPIPPKAEREAITHISNYSRGEEPSRARRRLRHGDKAIRALLENEDYYSSSYFEVSVKDDFPMWSQAPSGGREIKIESELLIDHDLDVAIHQVVCKQLSLENPPHELLLKIVLSYSAKGLSVTASCSGTESGGLEAEQILKALRATGPLFYHNSTRNEHAYHRKKDFYGLLSEVSPEYQTLQDEVQSYQKYFDVVFADFQRRLSEIDKKKKEAGKPASIIGFCLSCERQAVEINGRRHTKHVFSGVCQVCDEEQVLISLPCKKCSNEVAVSPWKEISCPNCDCLSTYDPNSLEADLGVPPLEENWGYCHLCSAGPSPSVMPFGLDSGEHALLCVNCFQFQKEGSLDVCGWCEAMVTGHVGTDRDPGCVWCAHDFEGKAGEEPSCSYELPSLADWKKLKEYEELRGSDIWGGF